MVNHNPYSLALLSYSGLNDQMNYMKSIFMHYKDYVENIGYEEYEDKEGKHRLWFMKIPAFEWDYVWEDLQPKQMEKQEDCKAV